MLCIVNGDKIIAAVNRSLRPKKYDIIKFADIIVSLLDMVGLQIKNTIKIKGRPQRFTAAVINKKTMGGGKNIIKDIKGSAARAIANP